MNVLFLASEAVPFAKTGGLADVAGSLPGALKKKGADIRCVLPLYRGLGGGSPEMRRLQRGLEVPLGSRLLDAGVLETQTNEGVPVYFLEREDMYDRPNLYGTSRGDYYDNLERFSFFSHGALRLADNISFKPDVVHCHDWQTGLVPAFLRGPYRGNANFLGTASVFTIHNIGYPGIFPAEKLAQTGLSPPEFYHPEGLEYWGQINLLKAGVVYSDVVTTVSPKYAEEIQTPEYGLGMEGILRKRRGRLHGILNGVDYSRWDPGRDPYLPVNYSPRAPAGKARCKEALIGEMGLDKAMTGEPLLGVVSRLDSQKGFDLLVDLLDQLLALKVGLVVLGSGDDRIQKSIRTAAEEHPGRVAFSSGFDEPLAHRIMAGADIFLIPSRYEPCGLTQIYAMKYGTVPLVRATGGLEDTVTRYNPETREGNGFKFGPFHSGAFLQAILEALDVFRDPEGWQRLMRNGMAADFSWDRSAQKYLDLYRSLQENRKAGAHAGD